MTIRRSWRKLLPLESEEMEETSLDNNPPDSEFVEDFRRLGEDLAERNIAEWLESDSQDSGYEHLDDDAIVDLVLSSDLEGTGQPDSDDDEPAHETPCPISHKDATVMFDKCLTWLQYQPEASTYNTSVLISLKDIAAQKRFSSLKQKPITSFLRKI